MPTYFKKIAAGCAIVLLTIFSFVQGGVTKVEAATQVIPAMNKVVVLPVGKQFQGGYRNDLVIKINSVVSDNRCPVGYPCTTAERPKISVTFKIDGAIPTSDTTIMSPGGDPFFWSDASGTYTINMLSVSPAKQLNKEIPTNAYRIVLRITRPSFTITLPDPSNGTNINLTLEKIFAFINKDDPEDDEQIEYDVEEESTAIAAAETRAVSVQNPNSNPGDIPNAIPDQLPGQITGPEYDGSTGGGNGGSDGGAGLTSGLVNCGNSYDAQGNLRSDTATKIAQECDFKAFIAYIQILVNYVLILASLFIVIAIAWTGIQYLRAGDKPGELKELKQRLWDIAIGIAIILGSWLIFNTVAQTVLVNGYREYIYLTE